MADITDKNPLNVLGVYYTDLSCIDCDLCRQIAPSIFARDEEEGMSFVMRQPETEDEQSLAEEAMSSCPTETIGDDGE